MFVIKLAIYNQGGAIMLPLPLIEAGSVVTVRKVGGSPDMKNHMEELGFAVGHTIKVVTSVNGNTICDVKGSRVAVSKEMSSRIMVDPVAE